MTERLVKEPVDHWVDSAVGVPEPQSERQDASLAGVEVEVDPQRDDVVRQPAGDEHDDDRDEQSHDRTTATVDGVAVGSSRRDLARPGCHRVTPTDDRRDGDCADVVVARRDDTVTGGRVRRGEESRGEEGRRSLLPLALTRAAAAAQRPAGASANLKSRPGCRDGGLAATAAGVDRTLNTGNRRHPTSSHPAARAARPRLPGALQQPAVTGKCHRASWPA